MGQLYVLSAPSGAGKTTISRRLLSRKPELVYSISYTTRPARPDEVDGRDYFFVSSGQFQKMIQEQALLEWAEHFGAYYGTGKTWVTGKLGRGLDVLVDVDVAGARQIKANLPAAVLIFIVPPTLAELERRLRSRHTETEAQLQLRLGRARAEIEARTVYDYLIINDDLERAVSDIMDLMRAESLRMERAEAFWPGFFDGS